MLSSSSFFFPSLLLFANESVLIQGWLPSLANASFAGGMAYYLLRYALPAMQQKFSDDLKQGREDYKEWRKTDIAAMDRLVSILIGGHGDKIESGMKKLEKVEASIDAHHTVLTEIRDAVDALATSYQKDQERWRDIIQPDSIIHAQRRKSSTYQQANSPARSQQQPQQQPQAQTSQTTLPMDQNK